MIWLINTDQTGWLPINGRQGNTNIVIIYDHDLNLINATSIKLRLDNELINQYERLYADLHKAGIKILIQKLDNEASKDLIKAIKD